MAAQPTPGATRVQLRRLAPTQTATLVTEERQVTLVSGQQLTVYPGDWIVYGSKSVMADVVRMKTFPAPYELVVPNTLILTAQERTALEATTGLGTTASGADLLRAVQRLATIAIGEVKVEFTPGQLEELKHRATKRGKTVEQEILAVVDRIRDEIFWGRSTTQAAAPPLG